MIALDLTEREVRALRDQVFELRGMGTDAQWDSCKDAWMQPEATGWLVERSEKLTTKAQRREGGTKR